MLFCLLSTFNTLIEIEDMGSDPYPGWKQASIALQ